jgi:hypothetical protein
MKSTYENTLTKLLTNLGCDEISSNDLDPLCYKYILLLRFNQKYMRLTLTMRDVITLKSYHNQSDVYKKIETEVFEFLLTGKNDVTHEILKTDST